MKPYNNSVDPPDPTFGYFDDEVHERFAIGIILTCTSLSAAWAIKKTGKFLRHARKTTVNTITKFEVLFLGYGNNNNPLCPHVIKK